MVNLEYLVIPDSKKAAKESYQKVESKKTQEYILKRPTGQKGNNLNTKDNNFKLNINYVLIHTFASM